ncbi:hypothetical protein Tco_0920450 [Tanacetum coccineum]
MKNRVSRITAELPYDLDDKDYDNHFMNYVLHHQRPGLSKSIDSNILFDVYGRTIMLLKGRVFLGDWLVVFPEYLDDDIPPFVRRLFLDKSKKQEKKKDGLGKAAKGKAAQLSDKGDKDNVMNGDLGEMSHKSYEKVAEVEETKSARQIVLKNKVRFLEAKVDKLYLDHDAKVGAGGGEVKGVGVAFGVARSSLGEKPDGAMEVIGGES